MQVSPANLSFSLAQRKELKETSTPIQTFPLYWKGLTEKSIAFYQSFGMTHRAFALRVSHGGDNYAGRWSFFHVVRVSHVLFYVFADS